MRVETQRDRDAQKQRSMERAAERKLEAQRQAALAAKEAEKKRQWDDGFLNLVKEPRPCAVPTGAMVTATAPANTEVTVSVRNKPKQKGIMDKSASFLNGMCVGGVAVLMAVFAVLFATGVI